ncbi:MAG: LytR C-terminal domain-containing protein, partial [Candidatus Levybacteria bacterium]|nr:LytR C-terminal domain-containing protein [Candidatus Levybacteria bacterium]
MPVKKKSSAKEKERKKATKQTPVKRKVAVKPQAGEAESTEKQVVKPARLVTEVVEDEVLTDQKPAIEAEPVASLEESAEEQKDSEPETKEDIEEEVKEEAQPEDTDSQEPYRVEYKRNYFMPIIFGILLGLGVFGAFVFYEEVIRKDALVKNETAVVPTEAPSPTEKVLDLSLYSIRVLNGSGVSGQAAKVQQVLEDDKFTVASIGNAEKSDYTETVIQVKKTVSKEYIQKLKDLLKDYYDLDEV